MLALIQTSLKHIFSVTINPDQWTLDEPNPVKGIGNVGQSGRWARTMQEIPVLSQKIKRLSQPGMLETSYILQYRAVFRFPGDLRYHQLPMRNLADITEYLTFLIQTHPDLLLMRPTDIDNMLSWPHTHVDPCLYQTPSNTVRDELSVAKLMVNSFIPVVEMDGSKDWLATLVWSIELSVQGSVNAYRGYFDEVLGNGQINSNPNLTGGVSNGALPWSLRLGTYEQSGPLVTDAYKPNPQTLL